MRDLSGEHLAALAAIAALGPARAATTSTTFTVVADAYVAQNQATKNLGTDTRLKVGTSPILRSYLRFSVQGLTGTVLSATLRVNSATSSTVPVSVFGVADTSWGETTITWNTRPALGAALGRITVPDPTPRWFEVDVTNYVRAQVAAGRRLVSFAFTAPAVTTAYIALNSLQASTNKPQLVIEAP
jgi:hypothetical protein